MGETYVSLDAAEALLTTITAGLLWFTFRALRHGQGSISGAFGLVAGLLTLQAAAKWSVLGGWLPRRTATLTLLPLDAVFVILIVIAVRRARQATEGAAGPSE